MRHYLFGAAAIAATALLSTGIDAYPANAAERWTTVTTGSAGTVTYRVQAARRTYRSSAGPARGVCVRLQLSDATPDRSLSSTVTEEMCGLRPSPRLPFDVRVTGNCESGYSAVFGAVVKGAKDARGITHTGLGVRLRQVRPPRSLRLRGSLVVKVIADSTGFRRLSARRGDRLIRSDPYPRSECEASS